MAETSQFVTELTDASFDDAIKSSSIAVIDCWAPWCGPCRMLAPTIEALAQEYQGKVKFYKLNTDESTKVVQQFKIFSIPTLLIFSSGKQVDTIVGAVPRQYIEGRLKPLMENK
jgi:thioredoxin 1